MKILEYNDFLITYIRQGNDKNGNPIYLVNIFKSCYNIKDKTNYYWDNINYLMKNRTTDKNGNIKIKTSDIISIIKTMINNYIN